MDSNIYPLPSGDSLDPSPTISPNVTPVTTNSEAYEDLHVEWSYEQVMLASTAFTLYHRGVRGFLLLQELRVYNQQECYEVADDFLLYLVGEYVEENQLFQALRKKDLVGLLVHAGVLAQLDQEQPVQFGLFMSQVREAFAGKQHKQGLRDLLHAIGQEKRRREKKLDVTEVARAWVATHRDEWGYDSQRKVWRRWSGTHWGEEQEKGGDLDISADVALHEAGREVNNTSTFACFQRLASALCKRAFETTKRKVNFANGVLDTQTYQLLPTNRDYAFTSVMPFSYDPYTLHEHIDHFLEETIPDRHGRQALMAMVGLALMGDITFHKFILLIGPPRAGKSTILALINAACGLTRYYKFAGVSLFGRDLEGKRSRSEWSKQPVVCVDEVPVEALREEEILKVMVAHGGVEKRAIGKDEDTDNQWKPKLFLSTNDTPHYKDTSGAIRQRAIIIECPNGPRPEEEQDVTLFERDLLPEIPAFAATCIAYGMALREYGRFARSAKMKETLDRISSEGNPLRMFLEDECVVTGLATDRIVTSTLHGYYKSYLDGSGSQPLSKNKFRTALHDMHIGITAHSFRAENRMQRGLFGIRLKREDEKEAEIETEESRHQDDPLLCRERITVYTVSNGVKRLNSHTVSPVKQPVEPPQGGVYTMYTMPEEVHRSESEFTSSAPVVEEREGEQEGETTIPIIEVVVPKTSYTSYTPMVKQPVEPSCSVYRDMEKGVTETYTPPDIDEQGRETYLPDV